MSAFIADHPQEVFYAFAYDCNPETKGIYLSFNTDESFNETLKDYKSSDYAAYYQTEDQINRLKYNPGDWKYQNFVYIEFIYDKKIKELFNVELDTNTNHLLQYAEWAMKKFRMSDVYKSIPKTHDFISFCINHTEDELDAINRALRIQ